ncbi:MAG: hypothetical protein E7632_04190 [Ruminococcaceae bacterium]|nr:hypothetical protein [Oscillospiraceae bacterium]
MKLFRSKTERELDAIIFELQQNLENNYKSVAQDYRRRLGERLDALAAEGKTDEKTLARYRVIYEEYSEKMKNYHH